MAQTSMHGGLTLNQYIALLEELRRRHGGELPVQKWMPAKGRHAAPAPKLAFERAYDKTPTHGGPAFFHEQYDTEAQRGAPVIRV